MIYIGMDIHKQSTTAVVKDIAMAHNNRIALS